MTTVTESVDFTVSLNPVAVTICGYDLYVISLFAYHLKDFTCILES